MKSIHDKKIAHLDLKPENICCAYENQGRGISSAWDSLLSIQNVKCLIDMAVPTDIVDKSSLNPLSLRPEQRIMPTLKLTDFGVSSIQKTLTAGRPGSLCANHLFGTCSYMSVEVIRGNSFGMPADVYAFATIAHEMLSGLVPFRVCFLLVFAPLCSCLLFFYPVVTNLSCPMNVSFSFFSFFFVPAKELLFGLRSG